ncbi:LppU/SCO3897 family protein [Streptomyces sp. NPDC003710]
MSAPPPPQGGYQAYGPPHQPHPQGQMPYGHQPPAPRRPSRGFDPRSPLVKVLAFAIAAICVGIWHFTTKGESHTPSAPTGNSDFAARVGDCMKKKGSGSEELEVVGCSDSTAAYRVESTGDVKGECEPGQNKYTETRRQVTILTLCLSQIKK